MNVVIVGNGKVGCALARELSEEGHSVTIIDNNQSALEKSLDSLDVMGVLGNGANPGVQTEARTQNADVMIASTSRDELNMLCCLMAKHLGAKHTIARIRNPEYTEHLTLLKSQFGLSMIINPELEAAREIARVIKFPPALKIETFSRGRVELVSFKLRADHPVAGKSLKDWPFRFGTKILVCAVVRGGEVTVPNGSFVPEAGDVVHITGETRDIVHFLHDIGHDDMFKIRNILAVGGDRVFYYLASMLDDKGIKIKVIEKNPERCAELCEMFPRLVVTGGDGTDSRLLESEGLGNMDAFIAMTGIDEENMIAAILAKHKKVPKVIAKVGRESHMQLVGEIGIDTAFNPKMTAVRQIAQYVRAMNDTRGGKVVTLTKLFDSDTEALEFIADQDTQHLGIPIEKLKIKKNLLIAVIVRDGKVIIPCGRDRILHSDSVTVITNRHELDDLNDIFES